MLRCLFGHKWSAWSDVAETLMLSGRIELKQFRWCKRCRSTDARTVQ